METFLQRSDSVNMTRRLKPRPGGLAPGSQIANGEVKRIISATIEGLRRTDKQRYFESTERGFQGWFFAELQAVLAEAGLLRGDRVVEMEYQKVVAIHGTRQRPDIVVHMPRPADDHASVTRGNLAVYALKKCATTRGVSDDLRKLKRMFSLLHYKVGIFVNIGARLPGMHVAGVAADARLHAFSARRVEGGVEVCHEWFYGPGLQPESEILGPTERSSIWPDFSEVVE